MDDGKTLTAFEHYYSLLAVRLDEANPSRLAELTTETGVLLSIDAISTDSGKDRTKSEYNSIQSTLENPFGFHAN